MAEREFMDPKTLSREQQEAYADIGHQIADIMLGSIDGFPPPVAYNAAGSFVAGVFTAVEFEQPQYALDEFDNWVKTVRQHLAGIIKERMQ